MSKTIGFVFAFLLLSLSVFLPALSALAAPFALKVNFTTNIGITPAGYVPDAGATYANRGNGFTYGWSVAVPTMSIQNSSSTTDPKATGPNATLYLSQAAFTNAVWEAQVPNGQYNVKVVCGDAQVFGAYALNVEGFPNTVSGTTTSSNSWLENTVTVVVTDGKLTIASPATGRLNWVEITKVEPLSIKVDFQPAGATPAGYVPDTSAAYAARNNGYTYGWSVADANAFTRTPDGVVAPVPPFNAVPYTTVVVAGSRTWEIAVPNGNYQVRVVSGDASGTVANLGLHEAAVEGQQIVSATLTAATAPSHFADGTGYVNVTDGKLSLSLPAGSLGKLHPAFIEITGAATAGNAIAPPAGTPLVTNRSASWVESVQPTASGAGSGAAGGPSSAHEINVATGTYSHDHGSDIGVRNPVGPSVSFGMAYRTDIAQNGYRGITGTTLNSSPGLPAGWTHEYDVHIEATNSAGWNPLRMYLSSGLAEDFAVVTSGMPAVPTGKLTPQAGSPFAVVGVASGTVGKWTSVTIIRGDESRMTFLPVTAGSDIYRLAKIENLLGQAIEIVYDGFNRVSQIRNIPSVANGSSSLVLLNTNFPAGSATPATFIPSDAYGRTVRYLVSSGQITAVSNIGNTKDVWTYAYQSVGGVSFLFTVSCPKPDGTVGVVSSLITYADDGSVISTKDANNNTETYLYQAGSGQTIVTRRDAVNKVVAQHTPKYATAFANRNTGSTDVAGNSVVVGYNIGANPYAPSDATNENGQPANVTYDAFSNVLTSVAPGGLASTLTGTTTFNYDPAPPATSKYPLGRVTSANLAPTGSSSNKTASFTYYASGLVNTVTGPAPSGSSATTVTTTYTYTSLGNVATAVMPGPNTTGTTVTYTYEYQNDTYSTTLFGADNVTAGVEALGEPIKVTDPNGNATHIRYDSRGRVARSYDGEGNRTDFTYNGADQLIQVTVPPTTATITARAYTVYTYAYDGGPLTKTDLYNEAGVLWRTVNAVKGGEAESKGENGSTPTVQLAYDGTYRVNSIKDGKNQETKQDYNTLGDLTEMRFPGNTGGTADKTQFTAYDALGNLNALTNGRGNTVTMTRQPSNSLVTAVTYGGFTGKNLGFTYDTYGRVTQRTDGAGVYNYTYGDLDEIVTITTQYKEVNSSGVLTGINLPTQTFTYAYNQNGSLRSKTIQNGVTSFGSFVYVYDNGGRVTQITPPWGGVTTGSVYKYTYDFADRLKQQRIQFTGTTPAGTAGEVRTQYSYNGRDQLTSLLNTVFSGVTIWNFNWSAMQYDAAGNRTQATIIGSEVRNASNVFVCPRTDGTANWYYDTNNRLTGESRTNSALYNELAWDYTTAGYVYDNAYNSTKLRNVATVLGYNVNNQLTGTGYGYDGDGNPTSYAAGTLTYDETNRLDSLTISGGGSPAYRAGYRGDGMRAWRVSSAGTVTYFVYDDATGTLQYEIEGSGATYTIRNAYGFGAAGLAQRFQPTVSNRVTNFAYDPSGNTITRSQSNGTATLPSGYPVEVALYDGYGYPKASVSSSVAYSTVTGPTSYNAGYSVGFGGQFGYYVENNTKLASADPRDRGLILATHRYYDPINARWLTRDPIGYDGDINLYGYVTGNPIMAADPSGLWTLWRWIYTGNGNTSDEIYNKSLDQAAKSYRDWQGFWVDDHKKLGTYVLMAGAGTLATFPMWPYAKTAAEIRGSENARPMGSVARRISVKAMEMLRAKQGTNKIGRVIAQRAPKVAEWIIKNAKSQSDFVKDNLLKNVGAARKGSTVVNKMGVAKVATKYGLIGILYFEAGVSWDASIKAMKQPLIEEQP